MPTGYTAGVQSGEITDFEDYAMGCARAFGALITMRDDPADATIPNKFEPDSYYEESLARAREELAELEGASDEEIARMAKEDYEQALNRHRERVAEEALWQERYKRMLEKSRRYVPPTPDHEEFAKFLVSQLEGSMQFDQHDWEEPKQVSPEAWKAQQLAGRRETVAYREEALQEEIERCRSRTEWVQALRGSLQPAAA